MKHLFSLSAVVLLALLHQVSGAKVAAQYSTDAPLFPKGVDARAAIAAMDARLHQRDLLRSQGLAALKKHEVKKAEALFKQALSFWPTDEESCMRLAEIHQSARQPNAVVADLEPLINPPPNITNSAGTVITTRMMYVLAQLDCGNWEPAAACYEKIPRSNLIWSLPGGGPSHPFPDIQFSPVNPDFLGLRAQAHLILGAYQPGFVEQQDRPQYMLEHLRQALKYNPKSLDATFLSGFMLAKMERFPEARLFYEKAMRMASKEARPEIQQALDALKVQENFNRKHRREDQNPK